MVLAVKADLAIDRRGQRLHSPRPRSTMSICAIPRMRYCRVADPIDGFGNNPVLGLPLDRRLVGHLGSHEPAAGQVLHAGHRGGADNA